MDQIAYGHGSHTANSQPQQAYDWPSDETNESDWSNDWHSRSFFVNGWLTFPIAERCPKSHYPVRCDCIEYNFGYEPLAWDIILEFWIDGWIEEDEAEKEEALQRECDQFEEEKRRQLSEIILSNQ
eukprot:1136983_1